MTDFDNTNSGAIFKNDNKESERHPDYKGSLNVGGVDHWVSSWIKVSKAGKTYMSLSVKPKDERQEREQSSSAEVVRGDTRMLVQPKPRPAASTRPFASPPRGDFRDMDDDVPF